MHRLRSHLTYANVVATIALFLALGGGTYAAAKLILPRNSVGTVQIKNRAVTHAKLARNAVDGSRVKDHSLSAADIDLAKLGKVPSASNADHAGNADNATHAGSADSATNATNSAKLGGADASSYQQTTARHGQVLVGAFSVRYPANAGFVIAAASYPVPLPAGTPNPMYHYVDGTSDGTCPGIGQAPSGTLCLYGYNTNNLHFTNESGGADQDPQRLYGWSFDGNATTASSDGYIIGSWAYMVP
jgi:hypothetical protein